MNARDELAREIFIADNAGQSREESTKDWAAYTAGSGTDTYAHNIADGLLAAGYAKPRTITTVAEMMALPNDSIVRDRNGLALHRGILGNWHASNGIRDVQPDEMETDAFPATVLFEPSA